MTIASNKGRTVLVVEDDDISRAGLAVVLRAAGCRVVAVRDGQEAMDYLLAGNAPDLILLDMLMPVVDGWGFLDSFHRWKKAPRVPILIATGTILTREWAEQHGCAGFLRKPIGTDELLTEVQRCMEPGGRRM